MQKPMEVVNARVLEASITCVWHAPNPEKTKAYMFGCEAISDRTPDSTFRWQAEIEGKK
jgi:hypothetical protein